MGRRALERKATHTYGHENVQKGGEMNFGLGLLPEREVQSKT